MMYGFAPLQPLAPVHGPDTLFGRWLTRGVLGGPAAHRELEQVLSCPVDLGQGPAPFFASVAQGGTHEAWARTISAGLSATEDRLLLQKNLGLLATGQAEVVITGQQPGLLGGPLYTLYKVATTVALARHLSLAGRPTVPVFWSGDDDDDLEEAFAPLGWDPVAQELFPRRGELPLQPRGQGERPCVGNLRAGRWSARTLQWLEEMERRGLSSDLGRDLLALWREAVAGNWSWSHLNRRFLALLFQGQGLLVVSGQDSELHRQGTPLYRQIQDRRPQLVELAARRGRELVAAGFAEPISRRSRWRHLFQQAGQGRAFLEAGVAVDDCGMLRPGVLLRSCVQDWLFRPSAVIVGPGELAYLRQLDPVYADLGIARCPLVPRLFGWVTPAGLDTGPMMVGDGPAVPSTEALARLTEQAGEVAEGAVARILRDELGLPAEEAAQLAAGRGRRWRRGVAGLLHTMARRQELERFAAGPGWVWPRGRRQERSLGTLCLAALLGRPLVDSALAAAGEHLREGMQGRWHEFLATCAPDFSKGQS